MRRLLRVLLPVPIHSRFRSCPIGLAGLWVAALLVLSGCPSPPGPQPPATPAPPAFRRPGAVSAAQRRDFKEAEALRARGQLAQAQRALVDFLRRYPASPLNDEVLLALGQIAASREDLPQARQAYARLVEHFPDSEHLPQAYLEFGVLLYQMQEYGRSAELLQRLLNLAPSRGQQALAHYYLGSIARQQQRYAEAVTALTLSIAAATDEALIQQARGDLSSLARERLTPPELDRLAQRYATGYPGDVLLLELAERYHKSNNIVDELITLRRFAAAFPQHPEIPAVLARVRDLQELMATDPTKIGILLPLSGEGKPYGQSALKGIELALGIWRQQHPDSRFNIVVRDSQGKNDIASAALQALVTEEHVIGVIGPLVGQVAEALAPLTERWHIPLLSPYAPEGDFPQASQYAFRNSLTEAFQARFLADYAVNTLKLHRFAILYPEEPYGISLKEKFVAALAQWHGEIVATASYPVDTTDFTAPIKRIGGVDDETLRDLRAGAEAAPSGPAETSHPLYDAVYLPGYYDKVGLIAPALAFFNITNVRLLGSDGWNDPAITDIGENFLDGAIFLDGFFAASPTPAVQAFVTRYQANFNQFPDLLAAQAYDAFLMLAQVLHAGAMSRPQLRDGLLQIQQFEGVSGTTSMNQHGDAEKTPYILTIQGRQIFQLE